MQGSINWKKYFFSFAITAIIFTTAIFMSNYLGHKKLTELRGIQDKIAIDILSSETQFSLLEESSCKDVGLGTLSTELGSLEEKLAYTENQRGSNDEEVIVLKRYYSLLEIKDYLLLGKIAEKCKKTPISIIYFYGENRECESCEREGYVLTKLRQDYPEIRVYSFDYDMDLSAIKTLISINKVKKDLPAIIVKDKVYYGYKSLEDMGKIIPEIASLKNLRNATTTTATSTKR